MLPVEGTAYDLSAAADDSDAAPSPLGLRLLRADSGDAADRSPVVGFDHCFVLDEAAPTRAGARVPLLRRAARLADPESGRSMTVWTSQPALQVGAASFFRRVRRGAMGCAPLVAPSTRSKARRCIRIVSTRSSTLRCMRIACIHLREQPPSAPQVYTANFLPADGEPPFVQHNAVCLETQHHVDAVNQHARFPAAFPDVILRPGAVYEEETVHVFNASS